MNIQTIFIVVIIIFFNFLLLNIFKLQKEISGFKNIIDKNNSNNIQGIEKYPTNYTEINNNNNDIITELDNIAKIVPIDINKRDDTDAKFIPKHKQI